MLDVSRDKLPEHVAIIMDGNGRWARKKGKSRNEGHRVGIEKIREMVEICLDLGIKFLTIYAFSCQNWKRPREEVNFLMKRFERYLDKEGQELKRKGVRLGVIGRKEELSQTLQKKIEKTVRMTQNNDKLYLNLAINYGGQEEIVDAVKKIAEEIRKGTLASQEIDVDLFRKYLYTEDQPYPDLLIRTSGEQRVSNFLLWQIAYAELWITPTLWPDFEKEEFIKAIRDYASRKRRFGGLEEE
ncbi:isoprenyl transferase [Candidatus Aerophobetes bacterium]|uniref:Isoprenyl transferase n=1 Tax=Aerophobetes bacterium TaxID=2030807 RepID=A0A523TJV8_UNCAE|nr:MAG: isoprenyl transferase [Candidatus Aerophobetes bacterium]